MSRSATPQLPPKSVHWFAAQALVLTLLLGFWPTPRSAYPALFHAHANALLAHLDAPSVRVAVPAPESGSTADTAMIGAERAGAPDAWESTFSVDRIGYWPSALLVAMLLATPLSALRRAAAIAIGLALLDLLTLARIGVEIAYVSYELALGPGQPARGPLHLLLRVGSESLTATIPSIAFVLVCWVMLASPWRTIDLRAPRAWIGDRSR